MVGMTPQNSSISSCAPHCDECPLRHTGVTGPDGAWRVCRCKHHAICRRCHWPITDDDSHPDHHSLCAVCAWDDLTRGRPPEDRHELVALLAALGLPPDTPVTLHLLHGAELDDDWGAYRIEWAVIPDVAWRYPPTGHVVRHPWRVQLLGWDAPRVVLRWRQWRPKTPKQHQAETEKRPMLPAFLVRTWRRDGPCWEEHRQVRAVDGLPSRSAVAQFKGLLGERDDAGREAEDLDQWLVTELRPAIATTLTNGQQAQQTTVATRLGLSLEGLQKKFNRLNTQRREQAGQPIRWKHLVADVLAEVTAAGPSQWRVQPPPQ